MSRNLSRLAHLEAKEVPLDQERETRPKPRLQPLAGRRLSKMRAALLHSFTGQAIAAVTLAHALLLPLLTGNWISAFAYVLAALGLSTAALVVVGRRLSRSVGGLRAAVMRVGASCDEATPFADARSTDLADLQRGIDKLYRRLARREQMLKAAYEVTEHENAASRQQLARLQRMARIGSWEWERASNGVVCSSEVFRVLGVNTAQFSPRPRAIQNLVHKDDRRAFGRWLVKLARGNALQGLDVRIFGQDE